MDRIVIKVGSLLLTQDNGHIDAHNIQNIAFQIADAIERYQAVELNDILVKTAKSMGIYLGEI